MLLMQAYASATCHDCPQMPSWHKLVITAVRLKPASADTAVCIISFHLILVNHQAGVTTADPGNDNRARKKPHLENAHWSKGSWGVRLAEPKLAQQGTGPFAGAASMAERLLHMHKPAESENMEKSALVEQQAESCGLVLAGLFEQRGFRHL